MAISVIVVAEDPLARAGLASLLAGEPDVALLGAFDPARAPLPGGADVVLWDLGARPGSALEELGSMSPSLPVVVLAPTADEARGALEAGARGALLRGSDPSRIPVALRAAAKGLVVADEEIAPALGRNASSRDPEGELLEPLTPREREVLALLVEGLSNKEIGARLGVSDHTAKFHINAILSKLGVRGRTEAVVRAARLGLVEL